MNFGKIVSLGLPGLAALFVIALIGLRISGLVRLLNMPSGSMTPAIAAGDDVVMEGITYLKREPHRGDLVVFKTDGIEKLPPREIFVKRVAGEPGDRVRIADGKLYVNDEPITLRNNEGEIIYSEVVQSKKEIVVPKGCYYLLGDNSAHSFDSRYWGCVSRGSIIGRVSYCYAPFLRRGSIK